MSNQTFIVVEAYSPDFLPQRATRGSAGFDVKSIETGLIQPGETRMVGAGFRIKLPVGWEAQIRSRSGLANRGIVVANSPGTIDSDYRGPVAVILHNQSGKAFQYNTGDRIAQMVIAPYYVGELTPGEILADTERGSGGFGSTGV